MDESSFGILLPKNTQLSGLYVKGRVRSKEYMNFRKMGHKFQKKGYSDIISFVYESKEAIHKYVQY